MPSRAFRARGTNRHARLEPVESLQDLLQRSFVELDLCLPVRTLHVQADRQIAPRDALADRFADLRLHALEAGRYAQPDIESAPVDGAQLPVPAERTRGPIRAGEPCHALDGHEPVAWCGSMPSRKRRLERD